MFCDYSWGFHGYDTPTSRMVAETRVGLEACPEIDQGELKQTFLDPSRAYNIAGQLGSFV